MRYLINLLTGVLLLFSIGLFAQEDCYDGIDNDNDGLVDCDDPDCSRFGNILSNPSFEDYICNEERGNFVNSVVAWTNAFGTAEAFIYDAPNCSYQVTDLKPELAPIGPSDGNVYAGLHNKGSYPPEPIIQQLQKNIVAGLTYEMSLDAYQLDFTNTNLPHISFSSRIELYGIEPGVAQGAIDFDRCDLQFNNGVDLLGITDVVDNTGGWEQYTVTFQAQKTYDRFVLVPECIANEADSYLGVDQLAISIEPETSATDNCIGSPLTAEGAVGDEWYQWFKDGVEIPGATESSYTPTEPGSYDVYVVSSSSCDQFLIEEDLGIEAPEAQFSSMELCDDGSGTGSFAMNSQENQITNGDNTLEVSFHSSLTEADEDNAPQNSTHVGGSTLFYTRVEDPVTGCHTVDSIELTLNPLPDVQVEYEGFICDEIDPDGLSVEDLEQVPNTTTTYHSSSPSNATDMPGLLDINALPLGQTIYVRIADPVTGCYDVDQIQLDPGPELTITPQPDQEVCPDAFPVQFTAAGQGGTVLYSWEEADPGANASFEAGEAGTYTVQIMNECDTLTDEVEVTVLPELELTPMPDQGICSWGEVTFNAEGSGTGTLNYEWQDGSTAPSYTTDQPGEYWVRVSDDCSEKLDTARLVVEEDIEFNPMTDVEICPGGATIFYTDVTNPEELGEIKYTWFDLTTASSHPAETEGEYSVEISTVCDTVRDTVELVILPELLIPELEDHKLCEGETLDVDATAMQYSGEVTYRWSNGIYAAQQSLDQPGTYRVTVTDLCMEKETELALEVVLDFQLLPIPDQTVCPGESVQFEIQQDMHRQDLIYTWASGVSGLVLETDVAGTYVYGIADTSGCFAKQDTVELIHVPILSLELGNDSLLCEFQTLDLNLENAGFTTFEWNGDPNENRAQFEIDEAGTYWVYATDGYCDYRDTIAVQYKLPFDFQLPEDLNLCYGDEAWLEIQGLTATYPVSYLWSTGSQVDRTLVNATGAYSLTVQETYCNYSVEKSVNVEVNDCDFYIYVPNTFTPNGDGLNDQFGAVSPNAFKSFRLLIFDRWGELIYDGDDIERPWNGIRQSTGEACQIDVYPWRIICEYEDPRDGNLLKKKDLRGHVNLVR